MFVSDTDGMSLTVDFFFQFEANNLKKIIHIIKFNNAALCLYYNMEWIISESVYWQDFYQKQQFVFLLHR